MPRELSKSVVYFVMREAKHYISSFFIYDSFLSRISRIEKFMRSLGTIGWLMDVEAEVDWLI